jgi:hypothetical protein
MSSDMLRSVGFILIKFNLEVLEQIYLNLHNFVNLGPLGSRIYINILTTNSRFYECQTKSLVLLLKCLCDFTRKMYNCVLCKLKFNEVMYLKELVSL